MGTWLGLLMRWTHITSAVTILGGFIYARFVVSPALAGLSAADGQAASHRMASALRPILYTALAGALLSGLYNYLTKASYPPHYHAVIGVKFLFVLHVFAVSVLSTMPDTRQAGRMRRLNWLVVSGLIIVAISAVLRWMTLNAGVVR